MAICSLEKPKEISLHSGLWDFHVCKLFLIHLLFERLSFSLLFCIWPAWWVLACVLKWNVKRSGVKIIYISLNSSNSMKSGYIENLCKSKTLKIKKYYLLRLISQDEALSNHRKWAKYSHWLFVEAFGRLL